MKKTLLLVSLLYLSVVSFAQTNFRFADSTAQWNVLETWQGWCWCIDWHTYEFNINGDTSIAGLSYQKIEYAAQISPLQQGGSFYIRRDSLEKVYGKIHKDSAEYLIYDFSKLSGDTFSIGYNSQWPSPVKITIDSVSTVFWNKSRKVQFITSQSAGGGYADIFVEGIGSLRSFFLYPGIDYSFLDGPGYRLLCNFENGATVYHDTSYITCVLDSSWTGIAELQTHAVSISPNPAFENLITIQSENNLPPQTTFQLFDITGRMVLQKQLTGATNRVELNEISKGMYLYTVTSNEKKIGSGKLVVQ